MPYQIYVLPPSFQISPQIICYLPKDATLYVNKQVLMTLILQQLPVCS